MLDSSEDIPGLGYSGINFLCCQLAVLTEGCLTKKKRLFMSESVLTKDWVCLLNCLPAQEAEKAIQCLNGKLALSKKLVVRWAHAQVKVSCLL